MHLGANVVAEQRELFAQIEPRAQIVYGPVPEHDIVHRRGSGEPRRQCFFTRGGASAVQQLKQGALSEDVQVLGVRVARIEEACTSLTKTSPLVVQTIEAAL